MRGFSIIADELTVGHLADLFPRQLALMDRQVRVGMVGTSLWADTMHLPALKSHPQAEIVAICGRNQERTAEIAQKYNIPKIFTDYETLIRQSGAEALIVATPDDLHYPVTIAALESGLHVLCEKPLALHANQALEMYEKAAIANVKHMTYFTWRWLPYFQYLCPRTGKDGPRWYLLSAALFR